MPHRTTEARTVGRTPVITERIQPDDLVFVADDAGAYYARVRSRRPGGGFAVHPLPFERPQVVRNATAAEILDHWQRAERRAVSARQLTLDTDTP